tara:strand:- start:613 stop:753 length:141 start_codon:yes stop_codon:yes gene_type:complete
MIGLKKNKKSSLKNTFFLYNPLEQRQISSEEKPHALSLNSRKAQQT